MLYSWIGISVVTLAVAYSMAVDCSAFPVAGGQYSWVAILAPPKVARGMSWITGWFMITGTVEPLLLQSRLKSKSRSCKGVKVDAGSTSYIYYMCLQLCDDANILETRNPGRRVVYIYIATYKGVVPFGPDFYPPASTLLFSYDVYKFSKLAYLAHLHMI